MGTSSSWTIGTQNFIPTAGVSMFILRLIHILNVHSDSWSSFPFSRQVAQRWPSWPEHQQSFFFSPHRCVFSNELWTARFLSSGNEARSRVPAARAHFECECRDSCQTHPRDFGAGCHKKRRKKENVEIHLVDIKELRKKESTSAFKPPLHEAFQFKSLKDSPPGYSTSSLLAAVISPESYVKEENII